MRVDSPSASDEKRQMALAAPGEDVTTPTDARIALIDIASVAISSTPEGGMDDLRKQMGVLKDFLNEQEALMALVGKVVHAYGTTRTESYETRHVDALFESVGKLAAPFKED